MHLGCFSFVKWLFNGYWLMTTKLYRYVKSSCCIKFHPTSFVQFITHLIFFEHAHVFSRCRLYVMTAKPIARCLSTCLEWSAVAVAPTTRHRREDSSNSLHNRSRTLRMKQKQKQTQTQSSKTLLSHPHHNKMTGEHSGWRLYCR